MKITKEIFKEATGVDPEQDDMDRCNCPHAGTIGHSQCGWNYEKQLPVFMCFDVSDTLQEQLKSRS